MPLLPPLPPDLPNRFSILEVCLRLRESALVFNRQVGGGLQFDAKKLPVVDPQQLPYAFVVPIDTVGKTINSAELYQPREAVLGIVVCVDGTKHKAQADGKDAPLAIHGFSEPIESIEEALLTWTPTGFLLDDTPMFERLHALGASENLAWVMLEYCIPYRYYNSAFGKGQRVDPNMPEIRADKMKQLFVKYKAEGEFPTVYGDHFFDFVPLPDPPTDEAKAAFISDAEAFVINDAVLTAVEDRGLRALEAVPQTHDGPFDPQP